MKNKYFLLILFTILFLPIKVDAKKEKVELKKCIDGDTIKVIYEEKEEKLRLLAIDAPEVDLEEDYSTESKDYLCKIVTNAKELTIEFDKKSDKEDKYERLLVWLYADGELVQEKIVKSGFAQVKYVYDKYKYVDTLNEAEEYAKENKLNIWSNVEYIKEEKKENKENNTKKKKLNIYLDRLSKSYEIIVILIAGILALITLYITRKK